METFESSQLFIDYSNYPEYEKFYISLTILFLANAKAI